MLAGRQSSRLSLQLQARYTARRVARRSEQRRWLQKPAPRSRPWAGKPEEREDSNAAFLRRTQQQNERQQQDAQAAQQEQQQNQPGRNTQLAETLANADTSDLVTEVHIPDDPHSVLPSDHPALSLLGNSSLVIQRQLEMMNVMLGFEQANRYIIMDGQGQTIGYIAEQDHGLGTAMARQFFKTHRSFTTHIFDKEEREVLRIHRPFAYINSRIRIYDPVPEAGYQDSDSSTALQGTSASSVIQPGAVARVSPLKLDEMRIIGEAQQQWAPLRRKYNLFSFRPLSPQNPEPNIPRLASGQQATSNTTALTESQAPDQAIEAGMSQFAHVNEPFLSWDFNLRDESGSTVGSVNRNFGGFAREIFTDTGVYALRMDSAAQSSVLESSEGKEVGRYERDARAMTLDQRAVMLATAVSIDFDYFSRHSHAGGMGGGFMPIFWPMGGGGAAEGAGAAGAGAGAVGGAAAEGGAIAGAEGAAGAAGRGLSGAAGGVGESGAVAAGTMAGYEAMQRGAYGGGSNPANEAVFDPDGQGPQQSQQQQPGPDSASEERPWWEQDNNDNDNDRWGGGGGGPGDPPPPGAGGEAGGEGGGLFDSLSDFFGDS